MSNLITKIREAFNAIVSLNNTPRAGTGAAGGGGGGGAFAVGGGVHGPGTSTSDSILAWLSDGEFVIRASSVNRKTLPLLQAINNGSINFGAFLKRLRGFDIGGLVNRQLTPSFANGGGPLRETSASHGRPVVVNFGGESFEMSASESVVHRLMKAAVRKKVRSNGRKPAWLGT